MSWERNPARALERLVEQVLGQQIFAVDFAWGFTRLERHLEGARAAEGPRDPRLAALEGQAAGRLEAAMGHLRGFVEEAELGRLDRGLAELRGAAWAFDELLAAARGTGEEARIERFACPELLERDWQRGWEGQVTRHLGESRAVFRCRTCGWEFVYVEEAPVGEIELPFEELGCPACELGAGP